MLIALAGGPVAFRAVQRMVRTALYGRGGPARWSPSPPSTGWGGTGSRRLSGGNATGGGQPCVIVISVPAATLSALSAAARGGVLFKGGGALETPTAVDSFAFGKTGTLTTGGAEVTGIVALDGDEDRFLPLLAGLEAHSEHHLAVAIRREAAARAQCDKRRRCHRPARYRH